MLIKLYLRRIRRLFFRRICPGICVLVWFYLILLYFEEPPEELDEPPVRIIDPCDFKPSTDQFIQNYRSTELHDTRSNAARVKPSGERMRNLLEIIRSKEARYQPLLETFDVFNMSQPMISLKSYTDESNIEEIRSLYNRYIKLMSDGKTVEINPTFIDYLRSISSYLSDGLRDKRTEKFEVQCLRKPVFVLACDVYFFDLLQGAIHTLDTHWANHQIIFYDMGLDRSQRQLLKSKCKQCSIIKFPFSSIEKLAPHIHNMKTYAFKPFIIQDALRRYGTIIYGDSSARFNENSFDPVLTDNYIRGFAARELPGHYLSCFTRSKAFKWFNQSYSQFDDIYMAEANFLVVTDTFLSRLIMKAWLICALEPDCLMAYNSATLCSRDSSRNHRYDQSAMVIILTYFFFQGNQPTRFGQRTNDPAPYDMFTSIQKNLGDISRRSYDDTYLSDKMIV